MGFKDIFRLRPQLSEADWAAAQAEGEVFASEVGVGPKIVDQPNPSLRERMIGDGLRRDPTLTPPSDDGRFNVIRQFVEFERSADPPESSIPPVMPDSWRQNS